MALVDLCLTSGQSQMSGVGTGVDAPDTIAGMCMEWDGGPGFNQIDDPDSSSAPYKPQTGSCIPSFANTFVAYSGRPIYVVRAAIGGTALIAANETANGNWSATGDLFPNSVSRTLAAISALTALGHTVDKIFSIQSLGFRDASGGNFLDTFGEMTIDILERWRTALSRPDFNLYLEEMYWPDAPSVTDQVGENCLIVQAEQHEAVDAAGGSVKIAFDEGSTYHDKGWVKPSPFDQLHYNQTGLNRMGYVFASYVATDLGFTTAEPPPESIPEVRSSTLGRRLLHAATYVPPPPPPDPVASPIFQDSASWAVAGGTAVVSGVAADLGTISEGDYLLAHAWGGTGSNSWTRAGWDLLAASGDQALFGKIATGAETNSDFSFTRSNTSSPAGVAVQRWSGVNQDTPVELVSGVLQAILTASTGTSLALTGATSNDIFRRAAQFVAKSATGGTGWTPPAGTTEHYDATASGTALLNAGGSKEVNAGVTGGFTWTVTTIGATRGAVVILVPEPGP